MHFTNVKNAVSSESLHCYPAKGESAQARPPAPQKAPQKWGEVFWGYFGGKTGIHKKSLYFSVLPCFTNILGEFWGCFFEFWGILGMSAFFSKNYYISHCYLIFWLFWGYWGCFSLN